MQKPRVYIAIAIAVLIMAMGVAYYFFDPTEVTWMPRCLWKVVTGTDCPGCGTQRMAHALMHGDFGAAWHANAYALCLLPVIVFLIWLEITRNNHLQLYRKVHTPLFINTLAISVIAWWVVRNLLTS